MLNIHAQHVLASSVAEFSQALVRCPFEVVKQNMQIGAFESNVQAVKHIYAQLGLRRGFYAGFGSFVMRDIPFSAIQFPLYEALRLAEIRVLAQRQSQEAQTVELPAVLNSVNGSIAGCTSGFLTTPMDVLKTKQMTFQAQSSSLRTSIAQVISD